MTSREKCVKDLWATTSTTEIAVQAGVSVSHVFRIAKRLGLKPKTLLAAESERPSPKEIKERAAVVRRRWTASEERRRRVGWGDGPYTVPQLRQQQVFPAFQGQLR